MTLFVARTIWRISTPAGVKRTMSAPCVLTWEQLPARQLQDRKVQSSHILENMAMFLVDDYVRSYAVYFRMPEVIQLQRVRKTLQHTLDS